MKVSAKKEGECRFLRVWLGDGVAAETLHATSVAFFE
jgi:hypothetical protein